MSRMLTQIETVLKTRLCERSHHGLRLTPAGEMLRSTSLKVLHEHDIMRSEIDALSGQMRGECRVAMPESIGRVLFLPLVQTIGKNHPESRLRVMAAFSASMPELLLAGQLDVAIVTDTHSHAGLETELLAQEDFVMIGQSGDAALPGPSLPASRLPEFPLILTAWSGGIRAPIDKAMASIDARLDVKLEIDSNQTILDLVRSGEGNSILPYSAVHREVKEGQITITRIMKPAITRKLFLATSSNRPVSPVSREVLRVVKSLANDHQNSGGWQTGKAD